MRYFPRRYSRPGAAPGTLTDHETAPAFPPTRRLIQFNAQEIVDRPIEPGEPWPSTREGYVTWLHLQGTPTTDLMQQLGSEYGLHPLALEDVINAGQRPKFDEYDTYYFIVMNYLVRHSGRLTAEQISLFLGDNFIISIHEGPEDVFDPVRARLQAKKTLRNGGADFLILALLDLIVDHGFPLVEDMADRLEQIEDAVLENPDNETLDRIHVTRRELGFMRRVLWPQREIINSLTRSDGEVIADTTRPYVRDVYDHTVQILELIEGYRDLGSSLLELYMSTINNRMNEVMKVLTMIATIFLPLSFIAGLYGMNFSPEASHWNMPELHWHYGYFYALFVMLIIAIGMIIVFKRKRWF
ncbi:MAG TPA: magnesium/cobalt transporter CorA [Gammaproteobacteria bacterium]|nr:magnesium/cobalt transporter CorA [Gammaproteobacteria bacterium]